MCTHSITFSAYREESMAVPGVGIDKLVEMGKLDHLKNGPIFWMDSADSNPRIGKTLCSSHYCKSVGL